MIQLIRGFRDILPGDVELWQHIEKEATALLEDFGFKELRIPIMERTELFARSIGEDTDIVEKEMYTFSDRKGDLLTLRPEATASIVRSYIQHKLHARDPVQKFYFIGPMFRRERPQKGRYRQFYQIDAEIFGVESPLADAELIYILTRLCGQLSISDVKVHLNSLGCLDCRPRFREALLTYLDANKSVLCSDCTRRSQHNPLRVLDCKVPACRDAMVDAPAVVDFLCPTCMDHFEILQKALQDLNITYHLDKQLVRGLDYYRRAIYEIQTGSLGAQSAVAGGGRYDGLMKILGGPDIPGTGFAVGFDRLAEISGLNPDDFIKNPMLYIAALGDRAKSKAFEWSCRLNTQGVRTEIELGDRSLKSQMKRANRLGADYSLIVGDNEIDQGTVILRDMATSQQTSLSMADLVDAVKLQITGDSGKQR